MANLSVVGKSVPRMDAIEKVTGVAKYTIDEGLKLPGMLYGKILFSPYPHAKILKIDTSRAKRLPGVKVIVTGKDMPNKRFGVCVDDRYILCRDKVLFVGDAVAAVAAETVETAEEALGLIDVEYEQLPATFDPEEAMRPDCPVVLHPDLISYSRPLYPDLGRDLPGPNVHTHHKVRRGNVEEGFRKADLIVENKFKAQRVSHCVLEPFNCVAYVESDGGLTIWTSVHAIFMKTQNMISRAFSLPLSKVRVKASYIAGNFGASPRAERFAALLALKIGKPVKVVYNREECFVDGLNKLPQIIYIKDGVKSDGTLLAREMKVISNTGAYVDLGPMITRNAALHASMYRIPNFKWDAYGVYTNEPCCGSFRGFGSPQPIWAVEQQMDIIAEKLGMDPVVLRKKNIVEEGEENLRGEITHSIGAKECLDKVAEWIEWGKPSEKPAAENLRRGKGLALGNKNTIVDAASSAIVKVHIDGTVEVRHGTDEEGQGINTVLAQIAAEEFKIPVEKVKIVWGDTAMVPYDIGAISSKSTLYTGNAVRLACQDAKRQMFDLAAPIIEVRPEDLETKDGIIYVREMPERAIRIAGLFLPSHPDARGMLKGARCLSEGAEILGKATFHGKPSEEDIETGQAKALTMSYGYTAQAAEVEVDIETGLIKLLSFCSAFDVGHAINPKLVEGQMEGGAGQGIGIGLYEEMIMDRGKVLNPNFTDYRLPSTREIPSGDNMKSMIVEAHHREGPFGAKGCGEAAATAGPPAIANAIYNAIGVRIMDSPITPEKVLKALRRLPI